MKKYILTIIVGLSFASIYSQGIADALRFSQNNLNGTARFSAMGGAFGALGGDFSAININPAGGAIYANNQVGVTLSNYTTRNQSNYFGTKTNESSNIFDPNQAGAVFVFYDADPKTDWKKFTLAINYANSNNFDNSLFSAGTNPNHSIADYFLSYANANADRGGILLGTLKNSYYENLNLMFRQGEITTKKTTINLLDITEN